MQSLIFAGMGRGVCGGLLVTWLLVLASSCGAPDRPNVLLIVADDMGYGDLSLHGNTHVRTPNLDALAAESVQFSDFYVSAVCSPTRAELLTGRHALDVGVTGTGAGEERLAENSVTLPEVLAKADFQNALFGKWHNGGQAPNHPLSRGFTEFFGFCEGHWASYFDAQLLESGDSLVTVPGYLPDALTDAAIAWLGTSRDAPTFTMLSFPTPHAPMQVPDRWYDAVVARTAGQALGKPTEADFDRAALAMVENLDWNVGRLLAALDSVGLRQNTIVIFMSDNGPNSGRWNAGMRGQKGSVDEGGTRSPLFLRWPERIAKGRTDSTPMSVRDLLPTLLSLVGLSDQVPASVDGRSFAERLRDSTAVMPEVTLARQWQEDVAVRQGDYLLDAAGRLYNLRSDRAQTVDLRETEDQIGADLEAAKADFWLARARGGYVRGEADARPFTVGHPVASLTSLTAGEAKVSRGVKLAGRWPNSCYYAGWTDTLARIAWPVDVRRAGRYRVSAYVLTKMGGVGSALGFGSVSETETSTSASATVPALGDDYLRDGRNDRVSREECYDQPFAEMVLGELQLAAGVDTLALTWRPGRDSLVPPATMGPEVRLVRLRWLGE